jgi:Raffinose synthase or seed imbibition protein Sip1
MLWYDCYCAVCAKALQPSCYTITRRTVLYYTFYYCVLVHYALKLHANTALHTALFAMLHSPLLQQFKGLSSLSDSGVSPRWLVLDDGWQSTSNVKAANGEQWMVSHTIALSNTS